MTASTEEEIKERMKELQAAEGPSLLEIKIALGNRLNLGRPTRSTHENKEDFMHFLALK